MFVSQSACIRTLTGEILQRKLVTSFVVARECIMPTDSPKWVPYLEPVHHRYLNIQYQFVQMATFMIIFYLYILGYRAHWECLI